MQRLNICKEILKLNFGLLTWKAQKCRPQQKGLLEFTKHEDIKNGSERNQTNLRLHKMSTRGAFGFALLTYRV